VALSRAECHSSASNCRSALLATILRGVVGCKPLDGAPLVFQPDLPDLGESEAPNRTRHLLFGVGEETTAPDGSPSRALIRDMWNTEIMIVTGCTTSVCVESTVRDAMFRDYRCLLLADCISEPIGAGLARSNHEASLLAMQTLFAG